MKKLASLLFFSILLFSCRSEKAENEETEISEANTENSQSENRIDIRPISHATAVVDMNGYIIYLDPVGGAEQFQGMAAPDLVLLTDIHEDHLNAETLQDLNLNTRIIAPRAVMEELPEALHDRIIVMNNGEEIVHDGLSIRAIPMYNLREEAKHFHPQGRGNGYVVDDGNNRLYIAGDTEDIPEMRNLEDIDVALVPMNLPYTMTIDQAADAVADFQPDAVYPYHFRGQDGFADVEKFRELVREKDPDIEVVLANWYPDREQQN